MGWYLSVIDITNISQCYVSIFKKKSAVFFTRKILENKRKPHLPPTAGKSVQLTTTLIQYNSPGRVHILTQMTQQWSLGCTIKIFFIFIKTILTFIYFRKTLHSNNTLKVFFPSRAGKLKLKLMLHFNYMEGHAEMNLALCLFSPLPLMIYYKYSIQITQEILPRFHDRILPQVSASIQWLFLFQIKVFPLISIQ